MTKHTDNSDQSRSANTVEEAWTQTFESYGVNPKQADLITKTVLGHSDISKGNPSGAEIRDIVEQHVSDVDYTHRLDDPNDEERVQEELLDALEDAIDGTIGGPLSAPRSIALDGLGHSDRTGGRVDRVQGAQPAHGLGNAQSDENVATDPPAEAVEEIRDFLAKVIEEQDLDPTAVKIAAAQLGTTADDQMSDN
jgi:hypothetical protein